MKKRKSKKGKLSFDKYLSILLVIVSLITLGLVFFIGVLPIEYFMVLLILAGLIDALVIFLLRSKNSICSFGGIILSILLTIVMIFGINYELNTIDFFKQFGFNSYKTENYNIIVLEDSEYEKIADLKDTKIGHLDESKYEGLSKVIEKLKKKIDFTSNTSDDIISLANDLLENVNDAIILEEAQLSILKEASPELYEEMKIIETFDIEIELEEIGSKVDVTKDSFNIYISGIDTYGKITSVSRSDVNIIVSVNPKKIKILLTSIPRDYYVRLHSFNDYDKLTHAGIYGIEESVKTLEDLLDTKINYYVKVNFTSLTKIVEALDGITVNSNYAFTSQDGFTYQKGPNTLNGEEALSFARERKSFSGGDRVRGENQEILLQALIKKAMSPKIITNYTDLLKALKNQFVTNITDDEITDFIKMQLNENNDWEFESISLDGTDANDYTYSYKRNKLYVMKPYEESIDAAQNKISSFLN